MATFADVMQLRVAVDTRQGERALDRFAGKAQQSGRRAERGMDRFNRSLGNLRNALYLGGAGALVAGGVAALDRFATRAIQIDGVTRSFDRLTSSVGINADILQRDMRRATRGAITDLKAMQQVNQALLLGIPATTSSMAEMAEIATKLGRAVGLDAAASLESLVTGIGRQSRLMLDNLGIVVDTNRAYAIYAGTLGKTVSELTDAEKKLAFFNETMTQARAKADTLGETTDTLGDKIKRLGSIATNAANDLINFFNTLGDEPGTTGLLAGFTFTPSGAPVGPGAPLGGGFPEPDTQLNMQTRAENAALRAAATEQEAEALQKLADTLPNLTERTRIYNELMDFHVNMVLDATDAIQAYVPEFDLLNESLDQNAASFQRATEAAELFFTSMGASWTPATIKMRGETDSASEAQDNLGVATQRLGQISSIVGQGMFLEHKTLSRAMAVVNTATGITRAWRDLPFWLAGPATAVIAASGVAQLRAIDGAGGGGGGGFGGAGISGGSLGSGGGFAAPLGDSGPGPRQVEVHIFLEGQGFIQDPASFARDLSREMERQMTRGGAQGIF